MNQQQHSLSDWDFMPGHDLVLDPGIYVSPPTALGTVTIPWPGHYAWVFVKSSVIPNVPDGTIVKRVYTGFGPNPLLWLFFRAQALPTNDLPDNCYYLKFDISECRLYRREAAVDTQIKFHDFIPDLEKGKWYHLRLIFYTFISELLVTRFRIILEIEKLGEWVEVFTHDDDANLWQASGQNRIGFAIQGGHWPDNTVVDDTEIWAKSL